MSTGPKPLSPAARLAIPLLVVLVASALVSGISGGLIRAGWALPAFDGFRWVAPAVISHAAHEPELSAATALILAGAREHGALRPLVEEARRQGLVAPDADVGLLLDLLLGAPFFQLLVRQVRPDPSSAKALVDLLLGPTAKVQQHAT